MRLRKLEVYGFKSFATRTEIVFNEGITGIVGPNGSGKSNIGDAVRWVLGEQSAKTLRGTSMQDVIFGGTQTRKPLSYCEVSLTFDNEDGTLDSEFAEVTVTRRVYRNGDSEYFLNRSACRLKDIVDLFRDTGIGKEGYSIIGQGLGLISLQGAGNFSDMNPTFYVRGLQTLNSNHSTISLNIKAYAIQQENVEDEATAYSQFFDASTYMGAKAE